MRVKTQHEVSYVVCPSGYVACQLGTSFLIISLLGSQVAFLVILLCDSTQSQLSRVYCSSEQQSFIDSVNVDSGGKIKPSILDTLAHLCGKKTKNISGLLKMLVIIFYLSCDSSFDSVFNESSLLLQKTSFLDYLYTLA